MQATSRLAWIRNPYGFCDFRFAFAHQIARPRHTKRTAASPQGARYKRPLACQRRVLTCPET